jgi:hypothetical protein
MPKAVPLVQWVSRPAPSPVLAVDLRGVLRFSSLGVRICYVIANAAAYTQLREQRRWLR